MRNIIWMRSILAVVLCLAFSACTGKSGSQSAKSLDPNSSAEPTLNSEIQSINLQLNQGVPKLSKQDVDALVQEGLLDESEDVKTIGFFIGE